VQVTSVAGVGQGYFQTPAALYVIDAEELRRSGHRTLAEALRLVPGVTVLHGDSNTWSIGIRGFNTGFVNKTLILIDGRSTYDPLQAGTYWDVQDILLEDLDRIEVIRGPGATLWGANAVNGVINVTTKSAKDTQGFYFGSGVGTEMRSFAETRYGWQVNDHSWARVWGKWADYDAFELPGPADNRDDWDMARGGYRYDLEGDDNTFFTMQGDAHNGDRMGETSGFDGRADGVYQLFRLGREVPDGDGWQFQAYYDMTERSLAGGLEVDRDTYCIIVTRGHNHDEEALFHLAKTPARYVGLIGSKRKIKLIFSDLLRDGISREAISKVFAPLGFEIGSQTVPEIAISIVAELIAHRNLGKLPEQLRSENLIDGVVPAREYAQG
ncbi:MAG TPA: TonB-dependent receptor plug domain-containing protein, partial [Planctomycetaceae bacterium]|nr:TonB-dependent receptor plug domain-containing protein [Planctomycetaceae bacterium]